MYINVQLMEINVKKNAKRELYINSCLRKGLKTIETIETIFYMCG